MAKSDGEIVIEGSELIRSMLFELAGSVSGTTVTVEVDEPFDPADAETWTRYREATAEDGDIVLVRYPEGYRLRLNGHTVWKQS